jgi:hypothetical protein
VGGRERVRPPNPVTDDPENQADGVIEDDGSPEAAGVLVDGTGDEVGDDAPERDVAAAEFPPAGEGEDDSSPVVVREKTLVGEGGRGKKTMVGGDEVSRQAITLWLLQKRSGRF